MQSVQAILTLSTVPVGTGPAGEEPAPEGGFLRTFVEAPREADLASDGAAGSLPVMVGGMLPLSLGRAGESLGKSEAALVAASAGVVSGAPAAPMPEAPVLFDVATAPRADGESAALSVPIAAEEAKQEPLLQGSAAEPPPSAFPDAGFDVARAKPESGRDLAALDVAPVIGPFAPPTETPNARPHAHGRVADTDADLVAAPSATSEPSPRVGARTDLDPEASAAARLPEAAGERRKPEGEIGAPDKVATGERTPRFRPVDAAEVAGASAVAPPFGRTTANLPAPAVFDGPTGAPSAALLPQSPTLPAGDGQASSLGQPGSPGQRPPSQSAAPNWMPDAHAAADAPVQRSAQGATPGADHATDETAKPGRAPIIGAAEDFAARPLHPGVWEQSFAAAADPAIAADHAPDSLGTEPLGPNLDPAPSPAATDPDIWTDGAVEAVAARPPRTNHGVDTFAPPLRTATAAAAAAVEPVPLPSDSWSVLQSLAQPLPQDPDPEDKGIVQLPGLASLGPAPQGTATAPLPAGAPNVHQLATRMTAQLAQSADGSTELALSPEELGKVRLRMKPDIHHPDRMVVMISFERPETLELFRRHAGDLADALRAAGYAGADIGFGHEGGSAPGSDRRPSPGAGGPDGPLGSNLPAPLPPSPARIVAGASLDLRL